jgi:capsular polysaccharide biosynthesis protein
MADNVSAAPGLLHPDLAGQFLARCKNCTDAELTREFETLARIPVALAHELLVDLMIEISDDGQPDRARLAIPALATALNSDTDYQRACLRLLVNRQFPLAVRLMRELAHIKPASPIIDEWQLVALRYHYRHANAAALAGPPSSPIEVLRQMKDCAAMIDDDPDALWLHELVEGRLRPDLRAPDTNYQAEPIVISPPWQPDRDGAPQPVPYRTVQQMSQGFALVRQATIIGARGTVFFGADLAIDDSLSNMSDGEFSPFGMESAYIGVVYRLASTDDGRRYIVARRPAPVDTIARGIFLNGPYQYNYFHWLSEYLSQMAYVNDQAAYSDWPLLISEEALAHANHIELIQRVAGSHNRSVIALKKDAAYTVRELLLPPKIARITLCHTRPDSRPEDYAFAPDAIRRLAGALAVRIPDARRRLFLSRKRNDRLINQEAIRCELEKAGFETVFPEDLSFDQARQLFAEAAVVAGPTGAAFTNLLLCPAETTAIIMTTDLGGRAGFFSALAGPLGQRVIYLCGPGSQAEQTLSPFEIDPAALRRLLKQLGIISGTPA